MSSSGAEIDFEIDAEDLPNRVVAKELGDPSVIVDGLHVTYRVIGTRKRPLLGEPKKSLVHKVLSKGREHAGGGVTEVRAVRGVSFMAKHGESIGIIGANGSGKSTLLQTIAGLLPPTQGSVYIAGIPSLLGVNAALVRKLSGERNILIGGLALGLTREQIEERFDEIVDFAGIREFVHLPMSAYSSGMAARLRFAISSAAIPDVLMIDEALATGDADFRQRSQKRIDEIREKAGTVFFVSHSLASVRVMCTRAIWLDKGLIRADGHVDEVADQYSAYVAALHKAGKTDRG